MKVFKLKTDHIFKYGIIIRPVNDEHVNNVMKSLTLNG